MLITSNPSRSSIKVLFYISIERFFAGHLVDNIFKAKHPDISHYSLQDKEKTTLFFAMFSKKLPIYC